MKKIVSVLAVVFSLLMCTLVGCSSNDEAKTSRIELTLDNYQEYLGVNFYYTDQQAISLENEKYALYCTGHFETVRIIDCSFENVTITYASPDIYGWRTNPGGLQAIVSNEGTSHTSFGLTNSMHSSLISYPSANLPYVKVTGISGFVIVNAK